MDRGNWIGRFWVSIPHRKCKTLQQYISNLKSDECQSLIGNVKHEKWLKQQIKTARVNSS